MRTHISFGGLLQPPAANVKCCIQSMLGCDLIPDGCTYNQELGKLWVHKIGHFSILIEVVAVHLLHCELEC